MKEWFNWKHETGEMIGSFIITFTVLLAMTIVHRKNFGIDTRFKKRMFLGTVVAFAVLFSVVATVGFGGHGQINPGVTLMVAALLSEWKEVIAVIGFQLIGAVIASLSVLLFTKYIIRDVKLTDVFTWTKQTPGHTASIELVGNVFWFLPIGGYLVLMLKSGYNVPALSGHNGVDYSTFGHFQLAVVASVGKFILIGMFEDFGAANFNPQIWFGKMLATIITTKKLPPKPAVSELSGLAMNLSLGVGIGYLAHVYLVN